MSRSFLVLIAGLASTTTAWADTAEPVCGTFDVQTCSEWFHPTHGGNGTCFTDLVAVEGMCFMDGTLEVTASSEGPGGGLYNHPATNGACDSTTDPPSFETCDYFDANYEIMTGCCTETLVKDWLDENFWPDDEEGVGDDTGDPEPCEGDELNSPEGCPEFELDFWNKLAAELDGLIDLLRELVEDIVNLGPGQQDTMDGLMDLLDAVLDQIDALLGDMDDELETAWGGGYDDTIGDVGTETDALDFLRNASETEVLDLTEQALDAAEAYESDTETDTESDTETESDTDTETDTECGCQPETSLQTVFSSGYDCITGPGETTGDYLCVQVPAGYDLTTIDLTESLEEQGIEWESIAEHLGIPIAGAGNVSSGDCFVDCSVPDDAAVQSSFNLCQDTHVIGTWFHATIVDDETYIDVSNTFSQNGIDAPVTLCEE